MPRLPLRILILATALAPFTGCVDAPNAPRFGREPSQEVLGAGAYSVALESVNQLFPRTLLTEFVQSPGSDEVKVYNTGFGSAVAPAAGADLYFLTDRGANIDYPSPPDGKLFPAPDFAPRIGRFRQAGSILIPDSFIALKTAGGTPLSGFPLPLGTCGATGEKGYFVSNGQVLERYDAQGIDSEGLVALPNGGFWISDEYGPFIARYDAAGKEQARYGPCVGTATQAGLPAVFAKRRANRGMEGLTITPSGILVGMMQSPLDNPRAAGRASKALRVLFFDPNNPTPANTKQYVYLAGTASLLSSEIVAIDNESFLVLERDGNFPFDTPGAIKRIYKASLRGPLPGDPLATDESDAANSATGKSYGAFGTTLESVTDYAGAGIVPMYKTLVVDLVADFPGYLHDKPEGIALIGSDVILISNDDDFGVGDASGVLIPKLLPGTKKVDYNSLWTIRISPPLR